MDNAVPFYLQEPVDPITKLGLANYLQTQSAAVPPDQAQINNAVMNQPSMPMPQRAPAQTADPIALKALQKYLPPKPMAKAASNEQIDAYTGLSEKSLADQQATLSGLNKYIDSIAAKPRDLDLSPIAAFIDARTGSKFTPVAQAMAPMSADERDKMLFGLRNQLATGQEKLSDDRLKAAQYAQTMQRQLAHDAEQARHNSALEQISAERGDGMMLRGKVGLSRLTGQAVDKILLNKSINMAQDRVRGANRIVEQLDAAQSGKIVDTSQLLADVNSELLLLMRGTSQTALGHLSRTEYDSLKTKAAHLQQTLTDQPTSINSPAILKQIRNQVEGLKGTYQKSIEMTANDLKRDYGIAHVNEEQDKAIDRVVKGYGPGSGNPYSDEYKHQPGAATHSGIIVTNGSKTVELKNESDLEKAIKAGFKRVN